MFDKMSFNDDVNVNSHKDDNGTSSSPRFWDGDDFTPCARHQFLQFYPFQLAIISLGFALFKYFTTPSSPIELRHTSEFEPLLGVSSLNPNFGSNVDDEAKLTIEAIKQKHFDSTTAKLTDDHGKPLGYTKAIHRDFSEKLKVAFEEFLLILQLALSLTPLIFSHDEEWSDNSISPILNLLFWAYLFAIGTLRVFTSSVGLSDKFPDFWYHSITLYTFQLIASLALFRSVLLGDIESKLGSLFYTAQFFLSCLIFTVSGSYKIGDKPAIIYDEENTTSSKEPTSSFFQIVSFGWINPLVFGTYHNGLQENDIWTLRYEDYAHIISSKFYNSYQKYSFPVRLLFQYKKEIFLQNLFTCGFCLLQFLPTVLLKYILEYLDHPDSIRSGTAWLYVFLMLASQWIGSCFKGRATFLGNRVSLRITSTLIGEIYSKGLRRSFIDLGDDESETDLDKSVEDPKDQNGSDSDLRKEENNKKKQKDLGTIINIMSGDASTISGISSYLDFGVQFGVTVGSALFLLVKLLGWPSLAGLLKVLQIREYKS
ncbi:unnamed protein product [Ambrosiozyma monospora]|uniref:Unnamed protein product n=1 Tax=Ambrosiozyma monospora TaxID=43982 RepID=A0ACB5T536_AMBMO|nr:unnamed protein product [Ambrosiozyma monospora]